LIKILDNFFEDKDLKTVQDFALNRAYYTPMFFDDTTEKTSENYYGDRFMLKNFPKLLNLFIKNSEDKFKIKINNINDCSGIDLRNLDHFKPHHDKGLGKSNILIMVSGQSDVTNGTVFYGKDGNLDLHIGFRENRAVMFPSEIIHSQHASKTKGIRRYTSTLFVQDYEEI